VLFALVILTACEKNNEPPPPSSGSPNAKPESGPSHRPAQTKTPDEQAQAMFGTVCVTCHGASGKGDGPAAQALDPKPRNYTDPAWQKSVTDDDLKKIILKGGVGVGKSAMMPAQPQLESQPEVLDGLVKIIRGFGKQ
jgi:mono/diheme cytochrome c family protein